MRVLCTCIPAYGHFYPMVPLSRALADEGHEVAFATAKRFHPRVAGAGFTPLPAGLAMAELLDGAQRRLGSLSDLSADRRWIFGARMFAEVAAPAMAADLIPLLSTWQPDLVLHDQYEFAAPLAATILDVPYVNHSWGIFGSEVFHLAAEASAPLWQTRHLQVPPLAGLFAHLYLDICPPSLQAPNFISNGRALALRPVPFDNPPREVAPPWINGLGEMPTVYLTLGTVFNDAIKVFATVLDALGGTQVNLVVTVGRDGDPARFGAQPGNVRVERYVAQSLLLPHCDLVVTHGGSGTMLAALAHGLPLLILPQGADNFRNARACEANGAARVLLPAAVSVEAVREEVGILLKDSRHRECAQRLHREIELMPGPEEVARQLEVFLDEAG